MVVRMQYQRTFSPLATSRGVFVGCRWVALDTADKPRDVDNGWAVMTFAIDVNRNLWRMVFNMLIFQLECFSQISLDNEHFFDLPAFGEGQNPLVFHLLK